MKKLDARGMACPEPVMLVRSSLIADGEGAEILVDNICAVENISRFAANGGYACAVEELAGGEYRLSLTKR